MPPWRIILLNFYCGTFLKPARLSYKRGFHVQVYPLICDFLALWCCINELFLQVSRYFCCNGFHPYLHTISLKHLSYQTPTVRIICSQSNKVKNIAFLMIIICDVDIFFALCRDFMPTEYIKSHCKFRVN